LGKNEFGISFAVSGKRRFFQLNWNHVMPMTAISPQVLEAIGFFEAAIMQPLDIGISETDTHG
jgi:hypothetical protein